MRTTTTTTTIGSSSGTDEHGNPASAPSEVIELHDRAVHQLLRFHPELIDLATELAEQHGDTACAQALNAYLCLMSTDEPDLAGARQCWEAMALTPMNDRETAHHQAIGAWLSGDWTGASSQLDGLLTRWPSDLVAMVFGHQLDFFLGDAANLRDRPGRSLMDLDPDHPHTAFVRGMQAFGLEEAGSYEQGRDTGLAAIAVNPDDVWATHAVVHTYEMQGMVDDGIRFLESRRADWGEGNLFTVHNWWHLALYYLEAGAIADALRIYDREVHHAGSAGVPIEMLDASALLWRLFLDGQDCGDRWAALADAWATRTTQQPWYAFNDLHAVMALVGAGRMDDAEHVVERLAGYVHRGGPGTNIAMTADIGLPTCRAVIRFAQGRYDDVVAELLPIRRTLQRFGGSHAQRDAMQRTLLEATLRAKRFDLSRSLVSERLSVRGSSVYGWTQRARLLEATGRFDEAAAAEQAAAAHRSRFAAAMGAGG